MFHRLTVLLAIFSAVSVTAAQDPSTGLRPGESIRFELRHFMLFGGSGYPFMTTRKLNLFFEFEYCVWRPRNRNAAENTVIKCNYIRRTKYWEVRVKNSISLSPLDKMVATLEFKTTPKFSFSDLDLEAQKRVLNPEGAFPSGIRVKLRDDGTWNSTLGYSTLMLPVRGGEYWPSQIRYDRPTAFGPKSFSVDGTDAKSFLFVDVIDDKGEPAPK